MLGYITAAVVVVALLIAFYLVGATIPRRAQEQFPLERERLCEEFFAAASASGKPRGLRWKSVDWTQGAARPAALFARDRANGEIVALLPVTIQFEATPGSDMEGLPAVGNLRNASAVFFYKRGRWHSTGKAVFNLNPDEAIVHFKDQYVLLQLPAPRAADTP